MPDRRSNPDNIDSENPGVEKFVANDVESLARMSRHRFQVESGNQSEAEVEDVKGDEEEENHARHALNRIEPVARVRVGQVVRARFPSNKKPIDGMVDERDKD